MAQNVFQMHRMRHDAQYENLQGLQQNALLRGVSLTKFIPPLDIPTQPYPPHEQLWSSTVGAITLSLIASHPLEIGMRWRMVNLDLPPLTWQSSLASFI